MSDQCRTPSVLNGPRWQWDYPEKDQNHADADGQNDYCRRPEINWVLGAIEAAGRTALVVALSCDQTKARPDYRGKS